MADDDRYFDKINASEKTAVIQNIVEYTGHHTSMTRQWAANFVNYLLLIHWGAIVSLAAYWGAFGTDKVRSQITWALIAFGFGVVLTFGLMGLLAIFSFQMSRFFRKSLKEITSNKEKVRWFETGFNYNEGYFYFSIAIAALDGAALVAGLWLAFYAITNSK